MPNPLGKRFRANSAICLLALLVTPAVRAQGKQVPDTGKGRPTSSAEEKTTKPDKTAYDYTLPGADGKQVSISDFKGKYLLIVNLARGSSYNSQLAALTKLNDTCKDKGMVVLGVPSNDFGASEPGTDVEIQKAYAEAKVDFPVMAVSKLTGDEEIPFYLYLTKSKGAPAGGEVHWNYTKFFVDKKGKVIARLDPDVVPDSPEMLATIDEILRGDFKPKKAPENAGKGDASGEGDE